MRLGPARHDPRRPVLSLSAISLVAVCALLAACRDDSSTVGGTAASKEVSGTNTFDANTPTSTSPNDPAFAQLCGVLNAALAGEIDVAKASFDHGPLHTLADEVVGIDRGTAARLLEAKEAVESDLVAAPPDATTLIADLERLIAASADAFVATGMPISPTCDEENP